MRSTCPIEIKRGGNFELNCALLNSGMAVPITGWQVDCWLRDKDGRLVQRLTVEMVDADLGKYRLIAEPLQTSTWPVGALQGDIRYLDGSGRVMHTATFTVAVLPTITTPAITP
jgi:hypothetical protein